MARRPRRNHQPPFKAKVALEAIKGEQIAAGHTAALRQTPDQFYFESLPLPMAA